MYFRYKNVFSFLLNIFHQVILREGIFWTAAFLISCFVHQLQLSSRLQQLPFQHFCFFLSLDKGCEGMLRQGIIGLSQFTKVKGDLRPKTRPGFYGIILIILWKKRLVQSFVVLWSVFMKLWSYKALNPTWVTSYPRMYKHFISVFLCIFFFDFVEKEPFTQFYGLFDHFSWTYKVAKFWMTKQLLETFFRMSNYVVFTSNNNIHL